MEFITPLVGCGSGGGFDPVSGSVTSDLGGCKSWFRGGMVTYKIWDD